MLAAYGRQGGFESCRSSKTEISPLRTFRVFIFIG
jgi:hypothetical protein